MRGQEVEFQLLAAWRSRCVRQPAGCLSDSPELRSEVAQRQAAIALGAANQSFAGTSSRNVSIREM